MDSRIKGKRIAASVVAAAAVLGLTSMALAAEFSADSKQSMPGPNGSMSITGKIFVKGLMQRQESSGPMGKQVMIRRVMIRRPDKGLVWMLMPAQKSYMEQRTGKADLKSAPSMNAMLKRMPNYKKVGTARIAGYICDKYTYKDTERKISGTAYISPQLKQQLKLDTQMPTGKMSYILSNIREGKQPGSLFSIPKGYKKMTMPMGGLGGASRMMPGMRGGKMMPGMPGMRGGKGMPGMPHPAPR